MPTAAVNSGTREGQQGIDNGYMRHATKRTLPIDIFTLVFVSIIREDRDPLPVPAVAEWHTRHTLLNQFVKTLEVQWRGMVAITAIWPWAVSIAPILQSQMNDKFSSKAFILLS
jgi:hypothetical protein